MSKPPPLSPPPLRKQKTESEASFRLFWLIAAASLMGLLLSTFLLYWLSNRNEVGQGKNANSAGGSTSRVANLDAEHNQVSASGEAASTVSEPTGKAGNSKVNATDSSPEVDSESGDESLESSDESVSYEEPVLLVVEEKPSPRASRSSSMNTSTSGKVLTTRGGANPFLGTGSPANSTVYVIDVSGSMQTADRLPRVIASLKRAVDQLNPEQFFMIVLFDDSYHVDPSSKGLILAEKKNVDKVFEWVDMSQGGGGTNPLPAMLFALQLRPERIVLLSDGEFDPTVSFTITQTNRSLPKSAKIDCVGLMEEVEVLKQIATSNKGVYYQAH